MFLATAVNSASAQTIDLGTGEAGLSATAIQLFALITVLSLAPGIAMMVTCFPFMVTVLSLLRQGLGVQAAPPNMLMVALALFMTWYVMDPVFSVAWKEGISPYREGLIDEQQAIERTLTPFRQFMEGRVDPATISTLQQLRPQPETGEDISDLPYSVLLPAFMLTEIKRAFLFGFLILLPFLIIDLLVSSILMALGMMMVPPVTVSLPLKLAFFVLAGGWELLAAAMVGTYAT
ncbi:MAG TPA: flagellar type III secretion system pore protein FliP [Alphaproteobacteria bacterium]|nr:flagellar type III secretion system pore protein FliP [Alphaproteobacteria bacterium]